MDVERTRLKEAREGKKAWKRWGPYLSERQWGTVREDYSESGDAWNYFSHDQARSRAYRWGEDGLAGISDDQQLLCFALALWNGKDPILKERLFGLTNSEGNHGEDVKEYYFYLDSTPTHSYMKYLYKYPQAAYPYDELVASNRRRSREDFEYELLDTGVFDQDRYFDVFVEYAKAGPEDILIQISVHNRGPEPATLAPAADTLVPQYLVVGRQPSSSQPPTARAGLRPPRDRRLAPRRSGERFLYCEGASALLFTENETNTERLVRRSQPDALRQGRHQRLRRPRAEGRREPRAGREPRRRRTTRSTSARGSRATIRLRLCDVAPDAAPATATWRGGPFGSFDGVVEARRQEADEFYASVIPASLERRRGQRHAPGAGGHAVDQAVLLLRRRPVAVGARLRSRSSRKAARAAQRALAPHVQRRRHLDAGQVGVPLVRGLGSRLPRPRADARRPGLRQGAARPDAARALPAPERPAPGLRVELRRRQSAGARLVDDLHLPPARSSATARATSIGSSASSTSCCSTSPGG